MTVKRKKPCSQPGCKGLRSTPDLYCSSHAELENKKQKMFDQRRGSSARRGYGSRWQKARAVFLKREPLCVEHLKLGQHVEATEVDHIIPHKLSVALDSGDIASVRQAQGLFWDSGNWQALCKECHSKKTVREDGGFGR